RKKIESSINNAKVFLDIQKSHGSFSNFICAYVNHTPIINQFKMMNDVPTSTELSDLITKDLKKPGFKFIGTTIIYAYMEAVGLVNDHIESCYNYQKIT
ncbi:MAG: DNA-3-methyladenine glycosylase I, partial [Vallitaleaceae bacterium]|nr:DNA-3-methyladenine glycosylase I [Vallitaleaceae bacterium]